MERLQSLGLMLALKGLIPFAMLTASDGRSPGTGFKVNIDAARIIEALIIAAVTALATAFISVKLLQQEIVFVKAQQAEYVQRNDNSHAELKREIERLQDMMQARLAINDKE